MAQTQAEISKRYRERHRERLRARWRAAAKTYREAVAADPDLRRKRKEYIKKYRATHGAKRMLADAKARAKEGNFPCTIAESDISIPECCPLLGVRLERKGPYAPSLDKIIPALGYVPGNVMVISRRANAIKHDATLEELQTLVSNLAVLLAFRGAKCTAL